VNSSPIDIESCGLQSVEEKLFLSVATMLDTKYRDAFDQPLLGRCQQVFCSHYTGTVEEGFKQGFGSGSVLDPYSIGPLDPDP
jgi:hypothetical protein